MVDAELIENQLIDTEEAKSQVAFSDVLLINKTDLVSLRICGDTKAEIVSDESAGKFCPWAINKVFRKLT